MQDSAAPARVIRALTSDHLIRFARDEVFLAGNPVEVCCDYRGKAYLLSREEVQRG